MLQLTEKIKLQPIALMSLENSSLYVPACLIMLWCIYKHKIKRYIFLVILPRLLIRAICVFNICRFANALTLYYCDKTKFISFEFLLSPEIAKTFDYRIFDDYIFWIIFSFLANYVPSQKVNSCRSSFSVSEGMWQDPL